MSTSPQQLAKQKAAEWAATQIEDGMAVGLGSGSTSALVIDEVGRRVAQGLRIKAIATSEASHRQALALNIPMTNFVDTPRLDLAIDGADEVQEGTLHLIKGHGGALLREKLVEICADKLLIAVDPSKLVTVLGSVFQLPVEVVPFAWETTFKRLTDKGFSPELRKKEDGTHYITDGHHYIAHCDLPGSGLTPEQAGETLKSIVGVVEHGLFLNMAYKVVIGSPEGTRFLAPIS